MVKKKRQRQFFQLLYLCQTPAYVGVELKYGWPTKRRGNSASSTVDALMTFNIGGKLWFSKDFVVL